MMNRLVTSVYEQLIGRLRRGGTAAKAVKNSNLAFDSLSFHVYRDGVQDPEAYIWVGVALWHQKNVYTTHDNKIQVTLGHLTGQQSQFTFFPRTGNCPPLDKIESKIREALDYRIQHNEVDTKRRADRQECDRVAAMECPRPETSAVFATRETDGTYTVTASFNGVTSAAVRQLYAIERSCDACPLEPAAAAPQPVSVAVEIGQERPKSTKKRSFAPLSPQEGQ